MTSTLSRRRRTWVVPLALVFASILTSASVAQPFPPPSDTGDDATLGVGIQRTMQLLESSTPDERNSVKILLYGQSITAGKWGVYLEEYLRDRYPNANLIYIRRPLSGFATERLVKTSEFDLYPTYADLVIFHDYGNNEDYETMIRTLREQTTAEIIIQADHLRRSEENIDESRPETIDAKRQRWAAERNYQFLPDLARRYGCGFDGRRDLWKSYLREHGLASGDLVRDDVHPNEHGTYLMTELIKAYFRHRDDTTIDPMNCGYVRTYQVGKDIRPENDALQFTFDGNRVDVVFHDDARGKCDVTVDGHPPLDDASMFYHGRNRVKWRDTPIPPGPWPAALRMGFNEKPVRESWSLKATRDNDTSEAYRFVVEGSVTGPDGEGRTDQDFVSDSGRVVIKADDWDIRFAIVALRRLEDLPETFQIDWNVETQASDNVSPPPVEPGFEPAVTAVQGLADEEHQIRLTGDIRGVKALRVYSPKRFPTSR